MRIGFDPASFQAFPGYVRHVALAGRFCKGRVQIRPLEAGQASFET
jgi:hypothetical protein